MVEFALAVTILLAIVFGIIEFAWILHGHITLTGAVREGARLAVVSSYSSLEDENDIKQEIRDVVIAHARTFDLKPEEIEVEFGNFKEEAYVEVSEAKLPLLIGFIPFADNIYVIKGTKATMMQE